MTKPTTTARTWVTEQGEQIETLIREAEGLAKAILDERVYANGIRGAVTTLRSQLDDTHATLQKLKKAIHDDFGSPEGDIS